MSRDAQVTVIGTMTRDIQLRYTASGSAVCEFSLAVQEGSMVDGKWKESGASFFDCTVWEQMAENCAESFGKGARVIVVGTLKQETWEDKDSGAKRSKIKLVVNEIGPSVRWATAQVVKPERTTTTAGNRPASRPSKPQYEDEEPFS